MENEELRIHNQEPGWIDFIQYYQKLEKLRASADTDTHRLVVYTKYCHDYIRSLTDYEYQYACSIPSFAERFERVEALYARIEGIIKEAIDSIIGSKEDHQQEA